MANVIDNFRNVVEDKYSVIKLLIMTVPVLLAVYAYFNNNLSFTNILTIIAIIIYSAIFFETIRRSCAAEPMMMPSFIMPIRIFITFGCTLIAAIPGILMCLGMGIGYSLLLSSHPDIEQNVTSYYIITFIFILLSLSLFFASVTQYLDSGNIKDSYNPVKIIKALNTFIVNLFFFAIQDAIFVGLVAVIPINVIAVVAGFDYNNFFIYLYASFFAVMNFIMFADFVAQTKKESDCD